MERSQRQLLTNLKKDLHDLIRETSEGSIDKIQLEEKIFNVQNNYNELIKDFELKYPEYYKLKFDTSVVNFSAIQKDLLDLNQTLIQYYVGEKSIYAFKVDKQSFELVRLRRDSLFEFNVQQYRNSITEYFLRSDLTEQEYLVSSEKYTKAAQYLFKILVEPLRGVKRKIIIIPGGILGYIPFEALLMTKPQNVSSYKTHPYMVREHEISYCYSTTLLHEMVGLVKGGDTKSLCFAPSFQNGGFMMPRSKARLLRYNVTEAKKNKCVNARKTIFRYICYQD